MAIPSEWLGKITTKQTIRKRKDVAKNRKTGKARLRQGQSQ